MAPKMRPVSRKQPDYIDISPRTIRFGKKTYQIKNLTYVETKQFDPVRRITNAALMGAICIFGAGAYAADHHASQIRSFLPEPDNVLAETNMVGVAAAAACTLVVALTILYGIYERFAYRSVYSLRFETNSGSYDVLVAEKRVFIDKLVTLITEIMDDESPTSVYHVNVNNEQINEVKAEVIMGDKFANIQNATIINRSVVEDALKSVEASAGNEVSEALAVVARAVEDSDNAAAGALFNTFSEELKKPAPNKSALRQCWDSLVALLPDVATIAAASAKIATLFR